MTLKPLLEVMRAPSVAPNVPVNVRFGEPPAPGPDSTWLAMFEKPAGYASGAVELSAASQIVPAPLMAMPPLWWV